MASAPLPGAGARAQVAVVAKTIVTITVRGATYRVAPFNLPLQEELIFARATKGMSVEQLFGADGSVPGLRSLKIIWWLARRASGESQLTLERAWDEWPEDLDIANELQLTIDEPDGKVSDPEV